MLSEQLGTPPDPGCQCPVFPIGKKMARAALMKAIKGYKELVEKIQAKAKERRYLLSSPGPAHPDPLHALRSGLPGAGR